MVNASLIDGDYNANINAVDGFRHNSSDGFFSRFDGYGLYVNYEDA